MKLAKSDKSNSQNNIHNGVANGGGMHIADSSMLQSPSALSRSMKYAEPWLYGTVRGLPTATNATYDYVQPQYTFVPELAVVLCSCREYLTGTKRDIKKATVCKKCKGSRLPITPIGGTMRIHSTPCIVPANHRSSAGTMRLPSSTTFATTTSSSSTKQRPSILGNDNDPYDVMRRSRLITTSDASKSAKSRAKSSSPTRNKDRGSKKSVSSLAANGVLGTLRLAKSDSRSRSATRIVDIESNWTAETMDSDHTADAMATRRSILQCNVNPYELISSAAHHNDYAPLNGHDDDVYDLHSQKYENLLNSLHGSKMMPVVRSAGDKRLSNGHGNMVMSTIHDEHAYEKVNFMPSTAATSTTTVNMVAPVNHSTYAADVPLIMPNEIDSSTIPRNMTMSNSNNNNNSNKNNDVYQNGVNGSGNNNAASPRNDTRPVFTKNTTTPMSTVNNNNKSTDKGPTTAIKSILKRVPAPPAKNQADNQRNAAKVPNGTAKNLTVRRSPPKKVATSTVNASTATSSTTSTASLSNGNQNMKNHLHSISGRSLVSAQTAVTAAVAIADGTLRAKQMNGMNFYMSLPQQQQQRKKVQFSVEHEVIDENGGIENGDIHVGSDNETDVRTLTDVKSNDLGNGSGNDTIAVRTTGETEFNMKSSTSSTVTTTAISVPKAIDDAVKVNGSDMTVQKEIIHTQQSNESAYANDMKNTDERIVINGAEAKTGNAIAHFYDYISINK